MKIVFFGTPDFSLSSLEACLQNADVVAVVTQPDKARGRGQKVLPCEVRARAQELGIPNFAPKSLRKDSPELQELRDFWKRTPVDLFVVTAYGNLLPQEVLDIPQLGCINVHASLLPKWRGAAPIQRSLEAGDPETGVCLQKMVFELDAGDVLAEARTAVSEDTNANQLWSQLSTMGGELLSNYLKTLPSTKKLAGKAQDPSQVSFAKKIEKEEGFWRPQWTRKETHNKVRAFSAWPQVKAKLLIGDSLVLETKIIQTQKVTPSLSPKKSGDLVLDKGHVYLACADGPLELLKIQPAGKAPLSAYDFLQNHSQKNLRLEPL